MSQPRKHESNALKQAAYRRRQATAHNEQMRSKGLPALPALAQIPGRVRWRRAIENAGALLEQTVTEMRSYYDDRSEPWQETVRAEALTGQIETLESLL